MGGHSVTLRFILLLAAVACFIAAALGVSSKVGLEPLGLALLTIAFMI